MVAWGESVCDRAITISEVAGIPRPVAGERFVTSVADNGQFSGTIRWTPGNRYGFYEPSTIYIAEIELEASPGWTFSGVPANAFTVAGALIVHSNADSGTLAAVFPATGNGSYLSGNIGTMVYVPPGAWHHRELSETTKVELPRPYRISRFEITYGQFRSVMQSGPDHIDQGALMSYLSLSLGWNHALVFCNRLSVLEGLLPVYSLPEKDISTMALIDIPSSRSTAWAKDVVADPVADGYRIPSDLECARASMFHMSVRGESWKNTFKCCDSTTLGFRVVR